MTSSSDSVGNPFMTPYQKFSHPLLRGYTKSLNGEDDFGYMISIKGFHEDTLFIKSCSKNITLEGKKTADVFLFRQIDYKSPSEGLAIFTKAKGYLSIVKSYNKDFTVKWHKKAPYPFKILTSPENEDTIKILDERNSCFIRVYVDSKHKSGKFAVEHLSKVRRFNIFKLHPCYSFDNRIFFYIIQIKLNSLF